MQGKVLIRTVTNYFVGELVAPPSSAPEHFVALTKCSWVADTGRFHVALKTGTLSEVEPYPPEDVVLVNTGCVVDICPWHHDLPENAK